MFECYMEYIKKLNEISLKDINLVGGKNSSLGEMIQHLHKFGVKVPDGYVITTNAYMGFLKFNKLDKKIKKILLTIDYNNINSISNAGNEIRTLIEGGTYSKVLENLIIDTFNEMRLYKVAVRSSSTAEDLPEASFAGQQDTFLNVTKNNLLKRVKDCFASLFNDRAISYRNRYNKAVQLRVDRI